MKKIGLIVVIILLLLIPKKSFALESNPCCQFGFPSCTDPTWGYCTWSTECNPPASICNSCTPSSTCAGSSPCSNTTCGTGTCLDIVCGQTISCVGPQGSSCGTILHNQDAGVVGYDSTLSYGAGTGVSVDNWRAKTGAPSWINNYKYQYWYDQLFPKSTAIGSVDLGSVTTGIKYIANAHTISSLQTLGSTNKVIYLINGDLNVNANISRANRNSFLGFIVNGNITFASNVTEADGFYLANSQIIVDGPGTAQFVGDGMFIAFGGLSFNRNLGNPTNNTTPSEVFNFDPSLVINAPVELKRSSYSWEEVAP